MAKHQLLEGIKPGQVIKAEWLNRITEALNANTRAIQAPKEKDLPAGSGDEDTAPEETATIGNEVFNATISEASDTTTVTITDDGGNDHDIQRVDTFEAVETTTGRTMTFNLTYTA